MKKRKLKGWVKGLLEILLVVLLGVLFLLALAINVEIIDQKNNSEVVYERIN